MYFSIRNVFSNSSEALQDNSEKKMTLFKSTLYGNDIEYANDLKEFNKSFMSSINNFENTTPDKKFILLYAWIQLITIISMQNVNEFDALNIGIKYIYELEIQNDIDQFEKLNEDFFNAYRNFYLHKNDKKENSNFVKNCVNYINEHIYEEFDLDELARMLHYNSYYLSKKFKRETGTSISQYLINVKVNEARILLEKDYSIKLISEKLCFTSQSYFTECFKKVLGITPKQYQYIVKKP